MTSVPIQDDVLHSGPVTAAPDPSRLHPLTSRLTRPVSALRQVPGIATYAGLGLVLAGGVLLVVAWGKTAGLTNVALQVPYLVSAGCTGLALVAVGLTVVSLAARTADARARQDQLLELQHVLAEIRRSLEEQR